eukprot:4747674-Alexandrium_andersonii.AAC.1
MGRSFPSNSLTLSSIGRTKASEFPEMASYWKGMDIKTLSMFLAVKVASLPGSRDLRFKVLVTCMWGLGRFARILDRSGVLVSAANIRSAQRAG